MVRLWACVYRLGGCSREASFIKTVSPWVSSSHSQTSLFFIPLSHKKQVVQHPSSCRNILRDQPLTGITYVLLKKALILLSAALSTFSLLSLHCPAISRPRPLRSSLSCHSWPIRVTHTRWRRLIPHSTERKVEPPKAPRAVSCVSFSMCS